MLPNQYAKTLPVLVKSRHRTHSYSQCAYFVVSKCEYIEEPLS